MSRVVFAGGVAILFAATAGSAMAADLSPVYKAPPVPAPAAYSWTGCYLGIEGGGNWGRSQHVATSTPNPANAPGRTSLSPCTAL